MCLSQKRCEGVNMRGVCVCKIIISCDLLKYLSFPRLVLSYEALVKRGSN